MRHHLERPGRYDNRSKINGTIVELGWSVGIPYALRRAGSQDLIQVPIECGRRIDAQPLSRIRADLLNFEGGLIKSDQDAHGLNASGNVDWLPLAVGQIHFGDPFYASILSHALPYTTTHPVIQTLKQLI